MDSLLLFYHRPLVFATLSVRAAAGGTGIFTPESQKIPLQNAEGLCFNIRMVLKPNY